MKKRKNDCGQIFLTTILGIYALVCLLPVLLVLIASFSSNESLTEKGFSFFPTGWSLSGWEYVFNFGAQLLTSYKVTIFITTIGTVLSLTLMSMFAYVLTRKDFVLTKIFTVLLIVTMLFDGGQVSKYIIYSGIYNLKDSLLVLILPGCITTMYVIIMRSYIQSNIPYALSEAAIIDGAGEFK